jgi:hypothetical protein
MTAPASRSFCTKNASCFGVGASTSARLPAVVFILSAVSMLSFKRTGMPCSAERTFAAFALAVEIGGDFSASGLVSMTELSFLSTDAMRSRYFCAI